jgi:hypothetical protein
VQIDFNVDGSDLRLTEATERELRKKMAESANARYIGRALRGLFLATLPLPDEGTDADHSGFYEWMSDVNFGVAKRGLNCRGYPFHGGMIVTGTTESESEKAFSPEKLAAIFRDGRIIRGEYRAFLGHRGMIVRITQNTKAGE